MRRPGRFSLLHGLDDLVRSDLITVAVGLLMALATFDLVRSFVENLIMPVIFSLFGDSDFPFLSFTIDNTQFDFGFVLSSAIAFLLVSLLAIPIWKAHLKYDGLSETRDCPECLTPIPLAAKRCPECTAVVTPAAG
jgi:large conductance mechanosensitive channel